LAVIKNERCSIKRNSFKKKKVSGLKKRAKAPKTRISKLSLLENSGFIGCLNGTGVTSKNYKTILH
jgi:hypothetical protein